MREQRVQPRGPGQPRGARGCQELLPVGQGPWRWRAGGSRLNVPGGLRAESSEAPAEHAQVSSSVCSAAPGGREQPRRLRCLTAAVATLLLPRLCRWGCDPAQRTPPRMGPWAAPARPAAGCPSSKRQILRLPRTMRPRGALVRALGKQPEQSMPTCGGRSAGTASCRHGGCRAAWARESQCSGSACEPAGSRPGKTSGCSAGPAARKEPSPSAEGQWGRGSTQRRSCPAKAHGTAQVSASLSTHANPPLIPRKHVRPSVWASQVALVVKNPPAKAET